jgi:alkylhydroperoxidase family enzyme
MTRVHVPSEHQLSPMGYLGTYAPEIVAAARGFSMATYAHSTLSLREFEAARMRTAQLNGCELCMNFRAERDLPGLFERNAVGAKGVADNGPSPDEALYAAVAEFRTAPGLSERERLAVEFAEGMGTDPDGLAQNEDFWSRCKARFTDAEIVDLAYCVAAWMGLGRVAHVLGADGVCAIPALREQAA